MLSFKHLKKHLLSPIKHIPCARFLMSASSATVFLVSKCPWLENMRSSDSSLSLIPYIQSVFDTWQYIVNTPVRFLSFLFPLPSRHYEINTSGPLADFNYMAGFNHMTWFLTSCHLKSK